MLSLLGLGVAGSLEFLEDETADEVANQADCLSDRPPPPSCQPAALAPPPPSTTPSDGDGGGTEPNPEVDLFPPAVVEVVPGNPPTVTLGLQIISLDTPPLDLDDVVVTVAVTITASNNPRQVGDRFFPDCRLDSLGTCDLTFETPTGNVTEVSVVVVNIGTELPYDFAEVADVIIDTTTPVSGDDGCDSDGGDGCPPAV